MEKKVTFHKIGNLYTTIGITLCIIAGILLAYPQLPFIFNQIGINTPQQEGNILNTELYKEELEDFPLKPIDMGPQLPDPDTTLTEKNILLIPKIGVKAEIQTQTDAMIALKDGPWIVPDYANPETRFLAETTKSIIIASHRFGYSSWDNGTRTKISFFKLPDTKIGDKITIIWEQREYIYEIVEVSQGTYTEDYDADLILYTCKYYNSPERIFRYANLITINGESTPSDL